MIILLIVAIVCTSIERARIESANTRCEQITYLALDSCFSNYGREVFEEYGLMMLWESEEDFLSEYENYVDKNCDYSKDIISKPMDFLSIDFSESEIKEILKATSNDGELIEKQICDYMEISLPSDIINELINNSKTLSQSEGINEFNEKMDVCNEYLTDVEECVEKIYDDAESLKNIEGNPKDKLSEMKSKVFEIRKSLESGCEVEKVNALYKEFLEDYIDFNQFITSVDDKMRSIMTSSNDYLVYTSDAQVEIENIKDYIDSKKGSYQKNIIEALNKEINVIDTEILSIKEDNYGVLQNEDYVVEQRKIIQNVVQDFEESKILIETNEGLELSEIEDSSELIESILVDIDEALVTISDFDKDNISINYNKKSGKEQKNEIVDFVEEIKDGGVISYVVKGDVSKKKINISELPSNKCKVENGKGWKNYGETEEAIRKAMVGQYIFNKFLCYTSDSSGDCLDYEIEYILKGKANDKDNLKEVIEDILIIREGFNFIYLLSDSQKKQEAYAMATAITGFTGMPVVIRITQVLILAAWAYAESIVDVKELLEGKRVSIVKTSEEWNLSLTGIKNLSSKDGKKQNSSGLLYEDYLRVFLFSQNKSLQIYRILDVVQINIAKKYNSLYKINDCIVSVKLESEYRVKRLFTDIGFIRNIIKQKNKAYIFEIYQEYCY